MSAQDNLSEQLFHGSAAELKPGDIVEPRNGEPHAWASHDPHVSSIYAWDATHSTKHIPIGNAKERKNWQRPMFGSVYTVEPLDKEEMLASSKEEEVFNITKVSKKGFKVTGLHSLATEPKAWGRK